MFIVFQNVFTHKYINLFILLNKKLTYSNNIFHIINVFLIFIIMCTGYVKYKHHATCS